jgi:tetratricopeptide (TPR) repeat protein
LFNVAMSGDGMKTKARAPRQTKNVRVKKRVESGLSELARAELVRALNDAEPAYFFKHALIQDTAQSTLLHGEYKRLNLLVARALENVHANRLDEYAAQLTQHFDEAGADERTFHYSALAGDVAARLNANAEAVEHYARALRVGERIHAVSASMQELFLKRGRALELQNDFDAALENYTALSHLAAARGDHRLELAASLAAATIYSIPTYAYAPERAQALSERALALARELQDRDAEAKILWNLMLMHSRVGADFGRAIAYGEAALEIARANNLRERLAYVLNDLSPMLYYKGQPELGARYNLEARAMWRALQNLPMLADNYGYAVMNHLVSAEYAQAIAASQEGVRLAREIGNEWNEAFAQTWVGEAYVELGEIETAERVMQNAIALGARAFPPALALTRSTLARMYAALGETERAIELGAAALQLATERFMPIRVVAISALVYAYIAAGTLERAREVMQTAPDADYFHDNPVYAAEAMRGKIELALAEQDFAAAFRAAEQWVEFLRRTKIRQFEPEALCFYARALSGLGKADLAAEYFQRAHAAAEAQTARWSLWQILAAESHFERARGNRETADALRTRAQECIAYIAARTPEKYRASLLERAQNCL